MVIGIPLPDGLKTPAATILSILNSFFDLSCFGVNCENCSSTSEYSNNLEKLSETSNTHIVINSGRDERFLDKHFGDLNISHIRSIISKIEKESPVELQAIGIGHDVTKYYKNALTINRAEELGEVLLEELSKLFKDWTLL